ncbi:hypothetical protein GmHk_01G001779 [Glycine max]|nr:hypothetical protein GmHk_01G001779 [Glycine max]
MNLVGKGQVGRKNDVVRLLPPRDSLTSSTPSSSTVSMLVKSSDVVSTPSPPLTEVRPSPSHLDAHGPSSIPTSTPSPSLIDARGLSLLPTSTSSPYPTIANMLIDEDVLNLAMEDLPLMIFLCYTYRWSVSFIHLRLRQRLSLCPLGNNLVTFGLHGEEFQKIVKNFFSSVFRKLVWRPEEENEIKKAFNSKASHRLSEIFKDVRNENKMSYWIEDHVWNDLLSHWNALEYRSKCGQAKKKNIEHMKGVVDHTIRLELGRSVYIDEDTGQFVDDRSRQTHAKLSQVRSNVASSVGESQHIPVDPAEEQRLMSWCRLQLGDQSVRDKFMALETLLVLMNLKMKTSCNIRKDLPVALKMPERLTDQGRSFVNQRNKCVNFSQLSFSSYLLKCETLFININNPTSNIMTSNSRTSSSNKTMTKQTTSNNIMSSRDTLAMTILIIELATQNYY